MKLLFKWHYPPCGNCPVQAEGWFLGYYFYFRARHRYVTIDFYRTQEEFENDSWAAPVCNILLKETNGPYDAGWLSKRLCKFLIYKGCFLFIFKNKYQDE